MKTLRIYQNDAGEFVEEWTEQSQVEWTEEQHKAGILSKKDVLELPVDNFPGLKMKIRVVQDDKVVIPEQK